MFIKKTTKKLKNKTYSNHLLVESVLTAQGPRHRVVCSLGSLEPAPREQWLALAHRMEASLAGQSELQPDEALGALVERARRGRRRRFPRGSSTETDLVAIHTDRVQTEEPRQAGPVHVGHQMWRRLSLDTILATAGLDERTQRLTEIMTLNRLVFPSSEHAMPDWIQRTALSDLLGRDLSVVNDEALYRNLDRLHPQRAVIEKELAEKERTLFNLEESVYLYDLTSTYFEGQCPLNPQAQRGYSRDQRPDCKQVLVGLVLDSDGFPKAHEVFEGNRQDRTTVESMLTALEQRVGKKPGATVVVDRGMAYDDQLRQIQAQGYHYIVAGRQPERIPHLAELEDEAGWDEILREPSPRNPGQEKPHVFIKRIAAGNEIHILCVSEGRKEKDRAIREKHEKQLLADLAKLQKRVGRGDLKKDTKIHEAIGRLKERYPRVARYYGIEYDATSRSLRYPENAEKKALAQKLDGSYVLRTDRQDLSKEEIWRTYILLTRVESAFRAMKSPLMERPIFHHLAHRVQTHIFLCVLAYHLLVSIEKMFLDHGIHTSWATLREELSTHQVVTIVLPTSSGETLKIRKGSIPETQHRRIYDILRIPEELMKPVKTWCSA